MILYTTLNDGLCAKYLKRGAFILLFSLFSSVLLAQNVNFSQFHLSPAQTNPAMIANSNQTRIMLNYRNQFIASGQAYVTPMVTVIHPWKKDKRYRRMAFALSAMSDQTGEGGALQTNGALATVAGNFRLNPNGSDYRQYYISTAVQGGYFQRSVNPDVFQSGSQWDGSIFDPNLPINEQLDLLNEQRSFPLLNAGLFFYVTDSCDNNTAYLGLSVQNINRPNVGFFSEESAIAYNVSVIGALNIWQNDRFIIQPNFRVVQEANTEGSDFGTFANQIRVGSTFFYKMSDRGGMVKEGKLGLSAWYDDNQALSVGLELDQPSYQLGFVYDLGVGAQVNPLSSGAWEVNFGLKFGKKCPEPRRPRDETIRDTTRLEVKDEEGGVTIYTIVAEISKKEVINTDTINTEYIEPQYTDATPTKDDLKIFKRQAFFYYISDDINQSTAKLLDDMALVMKKFRVISIRLEGHTCNIGDDNQTLSVQRAEAIKQYLTDKGVEGERIEITGFGDSQPVLSNSTEYGRIKNRRVEFVVLTPELN